MSEEAKNTTAPSSSSTNAAADNDECQGTRMLMEKCCFKHYCMEMNKILYPNGYRPLPSSSSSSNAQPVAVVQPEAVAQAELVEPKTLVLVQTEPEPTVQVDLVQSIESVPKVPVISSSWLKSNSQTANRKRNAAAANLSELAANAPKHIASEKKNTNIPGTSKGRKRGKKANKKFESTAEQKGDDDQEREEFDTPVAVPSKPRVNKSLQTWIPYNQRYGIRRSLLTIEEHKQYVGMLCSLQSTGRFQFKDNKKKFDDWKNSLEQEHKAFNECVMHMTRTIVVSEANKRLPPACSIYVSNCFQNKAASAQQGLPNKFSGVNAVFVKLPPYDPTLQFEKALLEVGKPARIFLPDMTRKAVVPMEDKDKIEKSFPSSDKGEEKTIKDDENLMPLVGKYGADFVASTSALRTLLSWHGPMSAEEWELPVFVKNIYVQGRLQPVVFLSKPLIPRVMDNRQRLWYMAKYAFKTHMVNIKFDAAKARACSSRKSASAFNLSSEDSDEAPGPAELDLTDPFVVYDADSVETALVSKTKTVKKQPETADKTVMEPEQNSDSDVCLIAFKQMAVGDTEAKNSGHISVKTEFERSDQKETKPESNLPEPVDSINANQRRRSLRSQSAASKTSKQPSSTEPSANVNSKADVLDVILSGMEAPKKKKQLSSFLSNAVKMNKPPDEDPQDYTAPTRAGRLRQYSQWRFKDFLLLTRSNVDGLFKTFESNRQQREVRASLSTKLEYQPTHGGEKLRLDEEVRDFWTAFLKRSDVHLRGRIKFKRDFDILAIERLKTDNQLKRSAETGVLGETITFGLRRMHSVLSELKKLNEGCYIVRGKAKEPNQFTVLRQWQEYDSMVEFDLNAVYGGKNGFKSGEKQLAVEEAWSPIDPNIIMQWHRIAKRIPATFQPRRDNEKPKLNVKQRKPSNKARKNRQKSKNQAASSKAETDDEIEEITDNDNTKVEGEASS